MKKIFVSIIVMSLIMPDMIYAQGSGDVAAVITKIEGKLKISTKNSDTWLFAKEGDFLYEGDKLKTDVKSMASITFVNGIEVKLNNSTDFTIEPTEISDRGKGNTVNLSVGQMWSRVLKKGTQFNIETPAATVAIRGTTSKVKVKKLKKSKKFITEVTLLEGTLFLKNEFGKLKMKEGTTASATMGSAPQQEGSIDTTDEKWEDTIIDNPKIVLTLAQKDAVLGFPVRLNIKAIGPDAGTMDVSPAVKLTSSNQNAVFSVSKKGKRSKTLTVNLKNGEENIFVRSMGGGSCVITAYAAGYDPGVARLYTFQPSKKNLKMKIRTKDGKAKELELKFRR